MSLYYTRMKQSLIPILLTTSLTFASKAHEDLEPVVTEAAISQSARLLPLFMLTIGIAFFFVLLKKYPQNTIKGCGAFLAITLAIGLIIWLIDFFANNAFAAILLGVGIVFAGLIAYMVYSNGE